MEIQQRCIITVFRPNFYGLTFEQKEILDDDISQIDYIRTLVLQSFKFQCHVENGPVLIRINVRMVLLWNLNDYPTQNID